MPPTVHVLLKFLWYLFSRLLIWGAAAALIVLAFFMAMDYMNASTLAKDGMQVRAEVIIKNSDATALSKVFSKGFLENDKLLTSNKYSQYKVSDFDYSAQNSIVLIFPWQNSVTLRITEKVTSITGQPVPGLDESTVPKDPPVWDNAVYDVNIVRYENSWRIVSMDLIEELPQPTPSPSESAEGSAPADTSPLASESPSASPSPSES
jgi:hypothetical protein